MTLREALRTGIEFDVNVGSEQLSICGSASEGWTVSVSNGARAGQPLRYATDELMFALINLSLEGGGRA